MTLLLDSLILFFVAGVAGVASYVIDYRNARVEEPATSFDFILVLADFFVAGTVGLLLANVAVMVGVVDIPQDSTVDDPRKVIAGVGGLFNRLTYNKAMTIYSKGLDKYDAK